jgi:hypothetical protein
MRRALGLLVVVGALAVGCASEGGSGGLAGGDGPAGAGSGSGSGGAGPLPGGLPVACPAAEDIGARLGLTVTLGYDGHVQGDPEVMCSYRVDGSDDNLSAWRASLQDADRAEARYWEYYMSDGDDPDDPNAPDLYTSVELDLGDASFAGTFADAREGGYGISGVARVRMDRTLCAVESSLTSESSQPPAGLHDTVVHLLSTLCGVGEAGGSPDAAGAWSDPCPAAADLGERVGEPVFQVTADVMSGDTVFCAYNGDDEEGVDHLDLKRFLDESPDYPGYNIPTDVTISELDLGQDAYLGVYSASGTRRRAGATRSTAWPGW